MAAGVYKIVTKSGFAADIDKECLDDMELVDALADLYNDDGLAVSRVASKLFTPEQKKGLYERLRNDKGRVPVKAFADEITEIFNKLGKMGKN